MPTSVKQLMEAANAAVPKITGKEAQEMVAKGALLVDVRDGTEVAATGKAAGAVHVPRGSLEFKADPESPGHDKNFSQGQDRDPALRLRRPRGARRQAAEGFRLRQGLQPRRLQGLGRGRRQGRQVGRVEPERSSRRGIACLGPSPHRSFARRAQHTRRHARA